MTPRFMPSARTTNWLITIGFLSLGYALYLRYLVIEQSTVGLACDAGLHTSTCVARTVASGLFNNQVFGFAALGAAALNLLRPSPVLFAIALALTGFGVVLYNAGLAALGGALLILSFARPASAAA
jgi:hypothetical protein